MAIGTYYVVTLAGMVGCGGSYHYETFLVRDKHPLAWFPTSERVKYAGHGAVLIGFWEIDRRLFELYPERWQEAAHEEARDASFKSPKY